MTFLWTSLILSIVLTIGLNLAVRLGPRLFPDATERVRTRIDEELTRPPPRHDDEPPRSRVQVWVPWKGMIVASVVLTVVLNVVLALR